MFTALNFVRFQFVFLIIGALFLCSCAESSDGIGGPCTYNSYPGTAVFTELAPVALFNFTLSNPTTQPTYLRNNGQGLQLYTWDGGNQTADWLATNDISVGVQVPATYQEITHGSCSPWLITFPTLTGAYGY